MYGGDKKIDIERYLKQIGEKNQQQTLIAIMLVWFSLKRLAIEFS